MHPSSFENMRWCRDNYINEEQLKSAEKPLVVDIGGADYNGSYKQLFTADLFDYKTADIEGSLKVDIKMDDPNRIPLPDESIDILISGQMLEHAPYFWLIFSDMARVLKKTGVLFLIAPSSGPIHRYPVDCYRFHPDAFQALADANGLNVLTIHHDKRGPWKDLVGVFSKSHRAANKTVPPAFQEVGQPQSVFDDTEETRATSGGIHYIELLSELHNKLDPRGYLEVGVRAGRSLSAAKCPTIAIDPAPAPSFVPPSNVEFHNKTSDQFFREEDNHFADGPPIDLAFIDGMHLFEYALRDFMEIERRSQPGTVIVVDDVFPNHPRQATRNRTTQVWTGDIWKLYHLLEKARPDLVLIPIDTTPTGSLVVTALDAGNNVLWDRYNPLVRQFQELGDSNLPESILQRQAAIKEDVWRIVEGLAEASRQCRGRAISLKDYRTRCRELHSNCR